MNTEKVRSADEIAEEIGQWFYGGTDEKRMMLVHRIKNAIESERRKKDESYAILEAELEKLKQAQDNVWGAFDKKGTIDALARNLKSASDEVERLKQKEKDLYASQCNWIDRSVALETRLAEACRVLKGMLEVPDLMKAEQVNLAIKKMDDAKAFLNSPTPTLQKGCVHDETK